MEKRTNRILHNSEMNKMRWKQKKISGVFLGPSFKFNRNTDSFIVEAGTNDPSALVPPFLSNLGEKCDVNADSFPAFA